MTASAPRAEIVLVSDSPERTRAWGERLAARLAAGDLVALAGPLGAGKTQWVKGLARGLGIDPDAVHSPTFTIINEYSPTPADGRTPAPVLYHVDAYRLSGPAELAAIGVEELAADGIVAVEWADRVADLLGPAVAWIDCELLGPDRPTARRFHIAARPDLLAVLADAR